MRIAAGRLTHCVSEDDGRQVVLGLEADDGGQVELVVSASNAGEIAAAVPQVLRRNFEARRVTDQARPALPLTGWSWDERGNGGESGREDGPGMGQNTGHMLLKLTAADGLEFSFSAEPAAFTFLAKAILATKA